jgi:GNAT superfamily N-acetyltransferase
MGYSERSEDVKVRGQSDGPATLTIQQAVEAAVANFRDRFRETVGSEPIVVFDKDSDMFAINTYGGGAYQTVGRFGIAQLHGCCGVVVFFHASVTSKFQKHGLGQLFLEVRQRAAVLAGYSFAQATVIASNKTERHLLEKAGFRGVNEFTNKRTGNKVVVYTADLG